MEYQILPKINGPDDVKKLSEAELERLAAEIRDRMIRTVSKNGGHLASNLGVVELTIALHRVFDSPNDKIVWDVGHQCYAHKLLTGRQEAFDSLRLPGGISGFTRRNESEHDIFSGGHSSSAAAVSVCMVSLASRSVMTPCSHRFRRYAAASASVTVLPTAWKKCMRYSLFDIWTRTMRMYPPPPRRESMTYPLSGVKREVMT